MVSDNREPAGVRMCPTVPDEEARRIVQQHITTETCFDRQEHGYHKCHNCVHLELARVRRDLVRMPLS